MDDRRFDAVARAICACTSRRQAIRLLAAGAVAVYRVTLEMWVESDGTEHLPTLASENLEILLAGIPT